MVFGFGNRNEPDTRFQLLCGFAGSGVGKRDGCRKVYDGTDGAETQRMEIQKEKFTEMKQEAEHKGVSDLQLSKQILQGIGLQSDGLIAQHWANLMEKSRV